MELEPQKIYIIGGIVDRNVHKGLCEGKAREQGIATAKLPIQDYVNLNSNKVLTVNQVFAMLVEWVVSFHICIYNASKFSSSLLSWISILHLWISLALQTVYQLKSTLLFGEQKISVHCCHSASL